MPHIRYFLISSLVACSNSGPTEITITTRTDTPFLVARNDTDAAWVTPTAIDAKTFRFTATGPYRVTAGCAGDDLVMLSQFARTLEDGSELAIDCGAAAELDATITSTLVQPGQLVVDSNGVGSSEPSSEVSVPTSPGTHAVVAISPDRLAVFRDIAVETTLVMPPIDLEAQGVPLLAGSLSATNALPDEIMSSLVFLEIDNTSVILDGTPDDSRFAPDDFLEGDDEQYIELGTRALDGTSRFASTSHGGSATLTLPEPFAPATFDAGTHDLTASWAASLTGRVFLQVVAFDSSSSTLRFHQLDASASYADSLAALTLDLESIPGIPASFMFDLATAQHTRTLTITDEANGQGLGFSRDENQAFAHAVPRHLANYGKRAHRAR